MTPTCQQPHWRPHPASDSDATPSQPRSCFIAPLATSHSVDMTYQQLSFTQTQTLHLLHVILEETQLLRKKQREREREREFGL